MKKKLLGFTFVELMIVVTIIIILTSIGFVSYTSQLGGTRNTKRISYLTNVYDLFQVEKDKGQLPLPDKYIQISFSGEVLGYQGYLSGGILKGLNIKDYLGKDPKYGDYFTYYLTKNGRFFEFMGYLEEETSGVFPVSKVYANITNYSRPVLIGDNIGLITDKTTNKPIQDLYLGNIDFKTSSGAFVLNVSDSIKLEGDNLTLGIKMKYMSINGTLYGVGNCTLDGKNIIEGTSVTAYTGSSIAYNAAYNCIDISQVRTCNNGVLSGSDIYKYSTCKKGDGITCLATPSYLYNSHTYSIPLLNHGQVAGNIISANVYENHGVFRYTLSNIQCNDGVYINQSENVTPTVISCDTGYQEIGNSCLPYVNGACTNLPTGGWFYNSSTSYSLVNAPNGTTLDATIAGYNDAPTQNTCQYKCDSLHYWNGNSCLPYVNGACTNLPVGALFYNSTTSYSLVNAPNGTTLNALTAGYQSIPTQNTCQYKCDHSQYYWSGSACIPYTNGACTNLPTGGWFYNSSTSYSLVNAPNGTTLDATVAGHYEPPTINTCRYKCDNLHYWDGNNTCIPYVNGPCTNLPENSNYYNSTTSYSLVNAPNGTTLDATVAGYNLTPTQNTCQRNCQPGFVQGGGVCGYLISACPSANSATNGTIATKTMILSNINNYIGCTVSSFSGIVAGITYSGSISSGNKMVLLAYPSDESVTHDWGSNGTDIATMTNFVSSLDTYVNIEGWDGYSNNMKITTKLTELGETNKAAQICGSKTFGGQIWYLPSLEDLRQLYCYSNQASIFDTYYGAGNSNYSDCVNKGYSSSKVGTLGSFSATWYWSSNEYSSIYAWPINITNGRILYSGLAGKGTVGRVRCTSRF
nr:hypothetical protein [Candidatus Gracilibacteria bacterium]